MLYQIDGYSGVASIVYLDENPRKFAIVHTERGNSIPGGGIEKEDTSVESAMYRELYEELGLNPEDVEVTKTDILEEFTYDVDKEGLSGSTVKHPVFLIKSLKSDLAPNDNEVLKASWETYEQAIKLLSWDNAKQTLSEVAKLLNIE